MMHYVWNELRLTENRFYSIGECLWIVRNITFSTNAYYIYMNLSYLSQLFLITLWNLELTARRIHSVFYFYFWMIWCCGWGVEPKIGIRVSRSIMENSWLTGKSSRVDTHIQISGISFKWRYKTCNFLAYANGEHSAFPLYEDGISFIRTSTILFIIQCLYFYTGISNFLPSFHTHSKNIGQSFIPFRDSCKRSFPFTTKLGCIHFPERKKLDSPPVLICMDVFFTPSRNKNILQVFHGYDYKARTMRTWRKWHLFEDIRV